MCRAAVREPTADGLKATVKVVLPSAATDAAGLAVTVKSALLVPSLLNTIPLSNAVPVFLIVKLNDAAVPTVDDPKFTVLVPETNPVPAGCSTTMTGAATAVPVPLNAILNGL